MKFIHKINLVATIMHTLLLLAALISILFKFQDLQFYAAYAHYGFGCFQVVLSLVCLFFLTKADKKSRKNLYKYFGFVILYFLILFAFSLINFNVDEILIVIYLAFIPMLIAFYFVYTTRSLMRSLEKI